MSSVLKLTDEHRTPALATALSRAKADFWSHKIHNVGSNPGKPIFEPNTTFMAAYHGLRQTVATKDAAARLIAELISITEAVPSRIRDVEGPWIEVVIALASDFIVATMREDPDIAAEDKRRDEDCQGEGDKA